MKRWITARIAAIVFPQLPWIVVSLLSISCVTLAVIQNRWIYQLSVAERERMHAALQADLNRLSQNFDAAIAAEVSALTPSFEEISRLGSEAACSQQYERWKQSHDSVFRRIGLLKQDQPAPVLYLLDLETGRFSRAEWPENWSGLRGHYEKLWTGAPPQQQQGLVAQALFGSLHRAAPGVAGPRQPDPGRRPENRERDQRPGPGEFHDRAPDRPREDWLVFELSPGYVSSALLPSLLKKDLVSAGEGNYDVEIVPAVQTGAVISSIGQRVQNPEASVGLLDPNRVEARRDAGPRRDRRGANRPSAPDLSQWRLLVRHRGRSLDAEVTAARWRNIALSGGILLLILSMVVISLHYARRSQHLAALQMNFVAGVSHELRTPLTVIRTAAYNLRGRVASRPDQVEQYGKLIQNESEKLSILVDQVLRYGAISSGRVIGERHAVNMGRLIETSIESSSAGSPQGRFTVQKEIHSDLPVVRADELALKHALTNLVDNAVKYGLEGSDWIGIFAEPIGENGSAAVEIRVVDRGPGIPADEQAHLFDAFFRGRRAMEDQIHGTGLGLNLVKSIIEAHGGTIRVRSGRQHGAEFIVRIPAAAQEVQDVVANTFG